MRCLNCGSEMPDGSRFCTNCGSQIPSTPQTPVAPANIAPQAPAVPSAPAPAAPAPTQPAAAASAPAAPSAPAQYQYPAKVPEAAPVKTQPAAPTAAPVQGYKPQVDQFGSQITESEPGKPKKKKKKGLIAAIVVLIIALLGGGGFLGYKLLSGDEDSDETSSRRRRRRNNDETEDVTEVEITPTDVVVTDPTETEPTPTAPVEDSVAKQTIMLYVIGSDLESQSGLASEDLTEIANSTLTPDTNIVVQTGGSTYWFNNYCRGNTVQRFVLQNGTYNELADLGRISMSQPGTLTDFITYTASEYPAEDYVLILWDHGGGIPIGYGLDELFPNDYLYDYQIGQALANSGIHFDSVVFDACNMCTLEVAKALQGSSDYMIGAESYVNGTGLAYTNWINLLANSPVSSGDYREQIVSDYMNDCHARGMVASMSSISLSHIDAVYSAYTNYIGMLSSDLGANAFADIVTARAACGEYMGTDSVDLITLANKYENDASTALINSIVNAVDYTESDYSYGHGLTAYFPSSDYFPYYEDARVSLDSLSYDPTITSFYDNYVSLCYAYAYGTGDASSEAGSWYDENIVDEYNDNSEITAAGEYHLDAQLATYDGEQLYYMATSQINYLSVQSMLYVLGADGDLYYLGCDEASSFDTDGDLVASNPEKWTYLNGYVACYELYDVYHDASTGEWSQSALIPVRVDGVDSYLVAYYDQDNPSGIISGYMTMGDVNNDIYTNVYTLTGTEQIQILWFNANTSTYVAPDYPAFAASEATLSYDLIDLTQDVTVVVYEVDDVYGNVYTSDAFEYDNGVFTEMHQL